MIQRATMEHIDMLSVAGIDVLNDLPNYASVECVPSHTKAMLTLYIGLPQLGCFFKEVNGEVVGLFMGIVTAPWFSPTLEMSEIMFWVRQDHRTTGLADRLMTTMEEWAIGLGAKRLIMAAASGYKTKSVERYYNWRGYKTNAVQCCKEL
jgi:GNAT superfamily N-acetyltransferase